MLAQHTDHLEPVDVGQAHVHDDERRTPGDCEHDRLAAGRRKRNLIAVGYECVAQVVRRRVIAVDDQHTKRVGSGTGG